MSDSFSRNKAPLRRRKATASGPEAFKRRASAKTKDTPSKRGRPSGKDKYELVDRLIIERADAVFRSDNCEPPEAIRKVVDDILADIDPADRKHLGTSRKQIVRRVRDRLWRRRITSRGKTIGWADSIYAPIYAIGLAIGRKNARIFGGFGGRASWILAPNPKPISWLNPRPDKSRI